MIEVTKKELYALMATEEFSKILDADPVLDEFEKELENSNDELLQFVQLTGNDIYIDNVKIKPLTAAMWTLLFLNGNRFVIHGEEPEIEDIEFFFYVLGGNAIGVGENFDKMKEKARKFGRKHIRDYFETGADLAEIAYSAFYPLTLLPSADGGSKFVKYDCDWLVRIATAAAKQSNQTVEYCMNEMPLALASALYVQHMRDLTGEAYQRRTSAEIGKLQMERCHELGRQFYCDKNGLKLEEVKWL